MNDAFKKNLEIKNNIKGRGVYTKVELSKGVTIYEFTGNLFTRDQIPNPLKPEDDVYVQIDKERYLGPSGDLDDLINHSCNPNCALVVIGKRVFLKTIFYVPAGTELTFDYSLTSTENKEEWQLNCKCGYSRCRKVISGFKYLDKDRKEYYKALGVVPKYVLDQEGN